MNNLYYEDYFDLKDYKYNYEDYFDLKDYKYNYEDYFDLKDYEYNYDDYNNILELRTLSKSEFNKLMKIIKKTVKEAKKNKQ